MIGDVDALATLLEARHGLHASDVADFFVAFHEDRGDIARAWTWAGVGEIVRLRQRLRLSSKG